MKTYSEFISESNLGNVEFTKELKWDNVNAKFNADGYKYLGKIVFDYGNPFAPRQFTNPPKPILGFIHFGGGKYEDYVNIYRLDGVKSYLKQNKDAFAVLGEREGNEKVLHYGYGNYVFYDETEKYYYLAWLKADNEITRKTFEWYMISKTEGVASAVEDYKAYLEEKEKERLEKEKEKAERERLEQERRKEREAEEQRRKDKERVKGEMDKAIENDAEVNPNNYKEVDRLPADISKKVANGEYFEHIGDFVSDDDSLSYSMGYSGKVWVYVNNADLSDGHKYQCSLSSGRYNGD